MEVFGVTDYRFALEINKFNGGPKCKCCLIRVTQSYIYTNHVGYYDQSTETNLAQLKHYTEILI